MIAGSMRRDGGWKAARTGAELAEARGTGPSESCHAGGAGRLGACDAARYPSPMTSPGAATRDPRDILHRVFGFSAFRGAQGEIVEQVLGGGDALVVMPTGGGKSLCYQLPAIARPGTGLVVSPLIALMEDQVTALRQLGVRAACLNSSLRLDELNRVRDELAAGALDLLYVAPERLMTDRFQARIAGVPLSLIAIDEAHCVSQWGHDFRPEYLQLAEVAERFPGVPRLALTATADPPTRREIVERLKLGRARRFVAGFDRPNIRYRVAPKDRPFRQLLSFLRDHEGASGIVYCLSRKSVDKTADKLVVAGFDALPYHAGLDGATRTEHQRRFVADEVSIIVATVAFGMGIDKPDVRFVAHLDPPKSVEAYYQETGRAGRDGLPAEAFMVYGLQDIGLLRRMIDRGSGNIAADPEALDQRKRVEHLKLSALLGYCETTRCRRQVLLEYFGEQREDACDNCDTCLEPVDTWDGTQAAQKALSAVFRTGERFGQGHLIDLLLGKRTDKIARFEHDLLPTFGVGADLDDRTWRSVFRQLVAAGLLAVDLDRYGGLRLAGEARAVLRGEREVALRRDALARTASRSRGRKRGGAAAAELRNEDDATLFESLRALRTELARAQAVPPYVIFADRSLIGMATHRPRTRRGLLDINGVGEVKLQKYGDDFLAVIAKHEGRAAPGGDGDVDEGAGEGDPGGAGESIGDGSRGDEQGFTYPSTSGDRRKRARKRRRFGDEVDPDGEGWVDDEIAADAADPDAWLDEDVGAPRLFD